MPKIHPARLVVLPLLLVYLAIAAPAQPPSAPDTPDPDDVLAAAHAYLDVLYAFDFRNLYTVAATDIVFDDPTSTYFGGPAWHFQGLEQMIGFFSRSSRGVTESGYTVEGEFATSDRAVLTVTYRSLGDGAALGLPGVPLELEVKAVTVLQVRDGKVVRHLDHVDYASMMAQVRAQKAAHEAKATADAG